MPAIVNLLPVPLSCVDLGIRREQTERRRSGGRYRHMAATGKRQWLPRRIP
jgi:hypothetical protein